MIALRTFLLCGAVLMAAPASAQDQGQSLADIRAELSQLAAQIQALRSELVTGGTSLQSAGGATALDRMDSIESQLTRLTARTEELGNRIDRVVRDGTNRVGDLEFRLCELEAGCDIGNMPITEALGGAAGAPALPPATASGIGEPATGGAGLAVGEQADFDRAKEALDSGSFRSAVDQFTTFTQTYTGGPLTGEAHFLRGEALAKLDDTSGAARAYLEAFSGAPNGPRAADSLLRLGSALGLLGQTQEACVTLTEVGTRFPGSSATIEAQVAMQSLGCQ